MCSGEANIHIIWAPLIFNSTSVVAMLSREFHVEAEQAEPPWKSVGATSELFSSVRSVGSQRAVDGSSANRPNSAPGRGSRRESPREQKKAERKCQGWMKSIYLGSNKGDCDSLRLEHEDYFADTKKRGRSAARLLSLEP